MWASYQAKTFNHYSKYQYVIHKLHLILEPYGYIGLQITYFAKADPECAKAILLKESET